MENKVEKIMKQKDKILNEITRVYNENNNCDTDIIIYENRVETIDRTGNITYKDDDIIAIMTITAKEKKIEIIMKQQKEILNEMARIYNENHHLNTNILIHSDYISTHYYAENVTYNDSNIVAVMTITREDKAKADEYSDGIDWSANDMVEEFKEFIYKIKREA